MPENAVGLTKPTLEICGARPPHRSVGWFLEDYLPTIGLADIVCGHVLYRYFDIDIPRRDFPLVRAYYDRLTERPAFRDHVMVSYEALRAEGA